MKHLLLVEDEAFIGIETEMALLERGQGPIRLCRSSRDTFDWLETQEPRAALLDFNLGRGETSEAIALELQRRGVPLAFLSGYTEATMKLPGTLLDAPRFSKPCHVDDVVAWLEGLPS